MEREIWKPIVGWEGIYSISDAGRMRIDCPGLPHAVHGIGHVTKASLDTNGYDRKCLCRLGRTKTWKYVHELVAEAFIGARPIGQQINHKNGLKHDNRVENLEYVTPLENVEHSCDVLGNRLMLGHDVKGEKHPMAKLSPENAMQIIALRKTGKTYKHIGKLFSISASQACAIVKQRSWKHIAC